MANVNQGMENIVTLGLVGLACPIDVYRGHLQKIDPPGVMESLNWQGVAVSQDALNIVNKHPSLMTLPKLFDWSSWYFGQQLSTALGFMGHEMDSLVYLGHHLRHWRVIRALALKKGRLDVVAKAELMILVLLVHCAVTACRPPIKVLSITEEKPRPGAGYFHAEVSPAGFDAKFPLLVGLVGQRSFGREARFDQGYFSGPLCEALGMMPASDETRALRAGGYDAAWGLTARQLAVLKLIVYRDVAGLREAFGWLSAIKCNIESRTEWRAAGMQTWLPKAPSGSTAPVNYRGVVAGTGEQRILCANNGERNTGDGDTDIGPSTTTIANGIARTVRDDIPAQSASCLSIGGALLAAVRWGPTGHKIISSGGGTAGAPEEDSPEILPPPVDSPVPPPVVPPAPKPPKRGGCGGMLGLALFAASISACSGCSGSKGGIVIGLGAVVVGWLGWMVYRGLDQLVHDYWTREG